MIDSGKVSFLTVWTCGKFKPCLGGALECEMSSLYSKYIYALSFNMEVLKAKEFTFAGKWHRRKGLQGSHGH